MLRRKFPDRRRFARAVYAEHQNHMRMASQLEGVSGSLSARQLLTDRFFQNLANAIAVSTPAFGSNALKQRLRRFHSEIRSEEHFLKLIEERGIDLPPTQYVTQPPGEGFTRPPQSIA
jgi:hypothetical protein